MKKSQLNDDLRSGYDIASIHAGVRGKYAKRVRESANVVMLEPEIAKAFPQRGCREQGASGNPEGHAAGAKGGQAGGQIPTIGKAAEEERNKRLKRHLLRGQIS